MSFVPENSKIYHITHGRNLDGILQAGGLWSDAQMMGQGVKFHNVGMPHIKRRRLEDLTVSCHPPTKVGDYVPFYFCPRSVMLYILYKQNHNDLAYQGGQTPILHLQFDLEQVIQWADTHAIRWAFTDRNAGTRYTAYFNRREALDNVNWEAVNATDFRDSLIREAKQAEFLVHDFLPFDLVEKIGVHTDAVARRVQEILSGSAYSPLVSVEPLWYY